MPKPAKTQTRPCIPLRVALTAPVVLLVIATAFSVGYLTIRNARKNAAQLTSTLQTEVSARISSALDDELTIPHLLNRLNAQMIAQSGYALENLADWRPSFFRHLLAFPSVTTCGFGTADGEFLGVGRLPDGAYDTAILDRSVDASYLVRAMNADGTTGEITKVVPDYDARSRAWYRAAVEAQGPTWSPVYTWASQNNIGISAVLAVRDETGELRSVQLVALTLDRISTFLASLTIGKSGYAFIAEPTGYLIGASMPEPLTKVGSDGTGLERVLVHEAESPIIKTAADSLIATYGTLDRVESNHQTTFQMDGQVYFLQARPYVNEYGLEWLIVTVVPAEDFTAQITRDTKTAVGLSLLALFAALTIGTLTTGWVADPIRKLNASAQALAQGNWTTETEPSPLKEVHELTEAFNSMSGQLRSAFDLLEQRVSERTAALEQANTQLKTENEERRRVEAEARRNEARLRAAQAVGHLGSWEYNVQTTEFWGSDEAKRIYGLDPSAPGFTTEQIESRIPERERVHQALIDLIEHGKPYNLVFEILPAGRPEPTIINSVAELVRDESGKPLKVIGVVQDISQRYYAQEEARRLNEELEQRVAERTAQLDEVQDQLLRQERLAALGQLAGSIGHELRNPLGVISNAVHYLQMTQPDADDTVKEYLEIIKSETAASSQIISDLLDLSQSRQVRAVDRAPMDIREPLAQALAAKPVQPGVEVILELPDALPKVMADAQQIRQVLTNLITNSYQAIAGGGKLTIRATADHEYLTLAITDTGQGIAPENINRIFEPLFTTKPRGIGLGLAICKMLVEDNAGQIHIESQINVGTTARIKLPVAL